MIFWIDPVCTLADATEAVSAVIRTNKEAAFFIRIRILLSMKNRYTFLHYSIKVQKRQMRELSVQVTRNLTDKMRQNFRSQFTDGKIKCKNFTNGKPAERFPFWRERGTVRP